MKKGRVDDQEKGSEGLREENRTLEDEPDSVLRLVTSLFFVFLHTAKGTEKRERVSVCGQLAHTVHARDSEVIKTSCSRSGILTLFENR